MVTFLHTADLHLGLRITRFEPSLVQKIREARFQALDNLVRKARELQVDFVLIAGDLFDDHAVDSTIANRAFRLLEAAAMPVYVLSGNHDPLLPGAVWDRTPWNQSTTRQVRLFRRAEQIEAQPGVVLLPCPVFRKTCMSDPTAWIGQLPVQESSIRIGVAHGSLKVREHLPADDHLIASDATSRLRLDYLALGHWHSRRVFRSADGTERTAYPGVHEPMGFVGNTNTRTGWVPYSSQPDREEFRDSGAGEALHVRIREPGGPPEITPVEVRHLMWQEEAREVSSDEDLSELIREIATRTAPERRLLRLKLSGVLDAATMMRVEELRQILEGRYHYGELDEGDLHVRPTPEEMQEVAGQGILRRVLEELQKEASSAHTEQRRLAERAILLLYQISREVVR